jgi:DNA (cytosine-5)-methyltransferase 1
MNAPRLLDLFCCAGGASVGYHRAGFDVVGVDMDRRHGKYYPFEFHAGDALEFVKQHGHEFDAIAASPPCQAYSITKHSHSITHPELIEPTREALQATGLSYIIENVVGAPLINPLRLCGSEFNLTAVDDDGTPLRMERHRLFESNVPLVGAGGCRHDKTVQVGGAYGGGSVDRAHAKFVRRGGYTPSKAVRAALLGIDWPMTLQELSQSIPPVYTEFLGRQLLTALR